MIVIKCNRIWIYLMFIFRETWQGLNLENIHILNELISHYESFVFKISSPRTRLNEISIFRNNVYVKYQFIRSGKSDSSWNSQSFCSWNVRRLRKTRILIQFIAHIRHIIDLKYNYLSFSKLILKKSNELSLFDLYFRNYIGNIFRS
jgi:hypothetical protein